MSSGYVEPPKCMTCMDSEIVGYCSNCKRHRCSKCGKRDNLLVTLNGDVCPGCFRALWDEAHKPNKDEIK